MACISLVPDIGWIWDVVVPSSSISDVMNSSLSGSNLLTESGNIQGAQATAKTAKIIRIIRLVRLLRFVKL